MFEDMIAATVNAAGAMKENSENTTAACNTSDIRADSSR
jgi:hypothetical protein